MLLAVLPIGLYIPNYAKTVLNNKNNKDSTDDAEAQAITEKFSNSQKFW